MRVSFLSVAVLLGTVPFVACSSGQNPNATPGDASGTGAGGAAAGSFTYSPAGCSYTLTPPASDTYTNMANDDATSIGALATAVPTRVRLGLGGGTTEGATGYADPTTTVTFTWETSAYNHAAKVRYGTTEGALSSVQSGYVWTTPALRGDISLFPFYMHEVHVCGLTPGTTYYYQVGGGPADADEWSPVQQFTTVPAPSSSPLTIGVLGDARDIVSTWATAQGRMKQLGVSMEILSGDLVDFGTDENDFISWLNAISLTSDAGTNAEYATLGTVLFAPISGNHEADSTFFFSNWSMPGSGDYAETYYSFNVGPAHIVMVDDTQIAMAVSGPPYTAEAKEQLAWVQADLTAANADRTAHPFIITMSHRGMYSSSEHATDDDVIATRTALAPLYAQYGVDLVINGHDHIYERSMSLAPAPIPSNDPVDGGTTYVICAGAGADPYPVYDIASPFIQVAQPFGSAVTDTSSPQAGWLGVYATMTFTTGSGGGDAGADASNDGGSSPTLVFTAYGIAPSGTASTDPVVDTFTLTPQQ